MDPRVREDDGCRSFPAPRRHSRPRPGIQEVMALRVREDAVFHSPTRRSTTAITSAEMRKSD